MRLRVADPLRWFSFETDVDEWTVFLAIIRGAPVLKRENGSRYLGLTFRETRQIIVSVHQDREEEDLTTGHEIEHAKIDGRVQVHHRVEEWFVSKLEVATHAVNRSLGFKLPRRPRGYSELKRIAMEIDGE